MCFNPCFNGSIFQTVGHIFHMWIQDIRFNPCFNGSIFQTGRRRPWRDGWRSVSILVLMEVSFRLLLNGELPLWKVCFNPCFNGSIFQTSVGWLLLLVSSVVSILVLMEVSFRLGHVFHRWIQDILVSILVLMEVSFRQG